MSKITPQKIHYRIIAKFSFPSLLDYPNPCLLEGKNKKLSNSLPNFGLPKATSQKHHLDTLRVRKKH